MDIKKLKTSQLLDKVKEEVDDELFGKIADELDRRTPFDYIMERIEEHEKGYEKLEKKVVALENILKKHGHLENGKSVIEI